MDQELEPLVDEYNDPRLIRGIHNYCHRWCERCSFTDRCAVFRDTSRYEREHPGSDPNEQVADSLGKTVALLAEWCEREGIDLQKLRDADVSDHEEAAEPEEPARNTLDADPLVAAARDYGHRVFEIVKPLKAAERVSDWPPEVRTAIETIEWYSSFIQVKIHRALHGQAKIGFEEPILQSDWNLTAKAARMAIAESVRAWKIVLEAGEAPAESPLRALVDLLISLDSDLAKRFPRAMEGVRPGFDESEVAAGAVTALESFDLRSWQRGDAGKG